MKLVPDVGFVKTWRRAKESPWIRLSTERIFFCQFAILATLKNIFCFLSQKICEQVNVQWWWWMRVFQQPERVSRVCVASPVMNRGHLRPTLRYCEKWEGTESQTDEVLHLFVATFSQFSKLSMWKKTKINDVNNIWCSCGSDQWEKCRNYIRSVGMWWIKTIEFGWVGTLVVVVTQ